MKLRITYLVIAAIVSFLFGALSRSDEPSETTSATPTHAGASVRAGWHTGK